MAVIISKSIIILMLLFCGYQDMRHKKIHLWPVMVGIVLTGVCIPFCDNLSLLERLAGVMIGIIVVGISLMTGGKIGMGDGIVLCATGLGLGLWTNLELFAVALALAAGVSIILLVFRLADRKKSIPFVPFLFTSYVLLLVI
ncbi:MAG: hypothetical protein QM644_02240 [Mobilitalea sp.]